MGNHGGFSRAVLALHASIATERPERSVEALLGDQRVIDL